MSEFKFLYFPIRGRLEASRIVLELNDKLYDDETFDLVRWRTMKKELTADGTLPYGQLPLLQHGDRKIVQSNTILKYLGRLYYIFI